MRRVALAFAVSVLLSASGVMAQEARSPTRIDFDERLIKGQTTKSGSVYIFDRQEITLRSLVKQDRLFRQRIIRSVFEE